jgi:hypothetical protein
MSRNPGLQGWFAERIFPILRLGFSCECINFAGRGWLAVATSRLPKFV